MYASPIGNNRSKRSIYCRIDGFKTAYNESYADESLPTLSSDIDYAKLNEEIKDMYHDFVETDAGKMNIMFVTRSYFEKV